MRTCGAALVVLLMLTLSPRAPGQRSSTALVLRVGPESRIEPSQKVLSFHAMDDVNQTAQVAVAVRALPQQQILVRARLDQLDGPSGPVPVTSVTWTGAAVRSSGGGTLAACGNGRFSPGQSEDLAWNWKDSGTLACRFDFTLGASGALPPGRYTGTVNLSVATQ